MARVTRLELAASAVTGRRSNQLSYTRAWVNEAYIIKAPPTCQRRFCVYAKKTLYSLISQDSRADDTQYRYANYSCLIFVSGLVSCHCRSVSTLHAPAALSENNFKRLYDAGHPVPRFHVLMRTDDRSLFRLKRATKPLSPHYTCASHTPPPALETRRRWRLRAGCAPFCHQ